MGTTNKNLSPASVETVSEIMQIYKSLPPRPTIEEIEAANSVISTSTAEQKQRLEEISSANCPPDVSPELFSVLQQVKKAMVHFQSHEQKKEALVLLEFDEIYRQFDALIQKASNLISGETHDEIQNEFKHPDVKIEIETVISDASLRRKGEFGESKSNNAFKGLMKSSSDLASTFSSVSGEGENEKLSLMKVAEVIEKAAKSGTGVLDLQGRLMQNVEWLPLSLGKLSNITHLNLSDNKIMALPTTICTLTALTNLDLHSNQFINLPDSIGELINLTDLDLHANRLKSLPPTFGNLKNIINLDLGSNYFTHLPDSIGDLVNLKTLNVETNELEDLPYTIGSCSSLVELRLDFNQLRALPEALGNLERLEILSLHYNRIKKLPTTVSGLVSLRDLDLSFNEIEAIPESLCFVVSLEKINVGKNFADLTTLPRSIGNLENLEELDISDCQIRALPESFRFLSKLRVFRADETPLDVPPKQVIKLGAKAVVEYMSDLVNKRVMKSQEPEKKIGLWSRIWSFFCH
jgi:Leucine-rich repeat (LRR) protein